jgi:hypothetical protein
LLILHQTLKRIASALSKHPNCSIFGKGVQTASAEIV